MRNYYRGITTCYCAGGILTPCSGARSSSPLLSSQRCASSPSQEERIRHDLRDEGRHALELLHRPGRRARRHHAGTAPATSTARTRCPAGTGGSCSSTGSRAATYARQRERELASCRLTVGVGRRAGILPDGKLIAFSSYRHGDRDIYTLAPDAAASARSPSRVARIAIRPGRPTARDSRSRRTETAARSDIYSVAADGTGSASWPGRLQTSSIRRGLRQGRRSPTRSSPAASGRSG